MWFFTVISYVALVAQILFITISIAAGLYYLAELVEEYTSTAKRCIYWINNVVALLYVGLWLFEGFPLSMILCGLLGQATHFVILANFPLVSFLSPGFIFAIVFVVINHYLAFSFFAETYYPFLQVIAYFTLFLWTVPFALFVSLSANDFVLPTTAERTDGDIVTNYLSNRNKKYGLLTFFNYAKESLLPIRTKKGF